MKRHLLSFLALALCALAPLFGQDKQDVSMPSRQFFIENKGQWPDEVKYLTRIGGMDAWVTNSGITYDFYAFKKSGNSELLKDKFLKENRERNGHVVAMRFKNSLENIGTEAREEQPGRYNYLIGEKSNWATDVRLFKEVSLLKVYDGIDARIYLESGSLRYDMVLKAGADPKNIVMTFDGADKISINKKGELVLKTSLGDVVQQKLFAFQTIDGKKKKVECSFAFKNGEVGFDVGKFDKTKPLVIDPLIYSTYIGGQFGDIVQGIAVDTSGAAYITGSTSSSDYPIVPGALKDAYANSNTDAFVTKLAKDGKSLVFSTFIGGKRGDAGTAIAVGKDLMPIVTGNTSSYEPGFNQPFPTTPTAYDTSFNSPGPGTNLKPDGFVLKLNVQGSSLVYSTYIGGSEGDLPTAITIDRNGNAYIAGNTYSTNLPRTTTRAYGSGADAFVAKFNPTGTSLLYLTYLGNTGPNTVQVSPARETNDFATCIAVDSLGNAFVTGTTSSEKFPVTPGAFDGTIGRGRVFTPPPTPIGPSPPIFIHGDDIFVTKLNANATLLLYSTFIGGDSSDDGKGIVVDRRGNAWITGQTNSSTAVPADGFPFTTGASDTVLTGAIDDLSDAVLVKLNPTGTALLYSTFIGAAGDETGNAIAIDSAGSVYLTGETNSPTFPTSSGLVEDKTYNGGAKDAFAMKFSSSGGGAPIYSSFLGGSANDIGRTIAVDTAHDAYIGGITQSTNFPFKAYPSRPYDSTYSSTTGTEDGFISKFRMECALAVDAGRDTVLCPGESVEIGNRVTAGTGLAPFRYKFTPSTGLSNDSNFSVTARPSVSTEYTLTVTDRIGCVVTDKIKVTINPAIVAEAGNDILTCAGKDTVLGKAATGGTGIFKYKWTPATGLSSDTVAMPKLTPTVTQRYYVLVTDSRGCTGIDSVNVVITNPISFASTAPASGLDFGSLSACQTDSSMTFTITNNSGRIVKVTGYSISNSAFKITTPAAGFNLRADPSRSDAKKTLTVKFSPQSSGTFTDSLQLITDPCGEVYTVKLTGTKLQSFVKADTNIYNFGKSYTCQTAVTRDTTVTIRNSGTGDITVQAPTVPAPYSLIDPPLSQFPKVLKAGEFVSLKIRLTQPATEGPVNGILEVPYQSAACPASSISIDLVSERVRTGADISFKNITLPDITGCDTYRDTVIVFKNTGTESITIESMDPANGLQLLGTLPLTIQPGETDSVRVRYAPDAATTSVQGAFTYGPCSEKLVATLSGSRKGISFQMPASIQADTVVLCKGTSSTGTSSITNKSGVDVALREDAVVTGPFTVTNLLKGMVFKNGIAQNFTYTFTSTTAGTFTGTLVLKFDLCDFDTTILLKATAGEPKLAAQTLLAMGVVTVGSFKEDSVEVKNTGTTSITINQLSGITAPFSIVKPTPGFSIQPGQSVFVHIRFDAAVAGVFKETLVIESTNPCTISLKTEITAGENSIPNNIGKAQITIGRDTSASGTTVRIPLTINASTNLAQSNAKNYTAVISFNKNLLKPTGNTPQGTINGNKRTITISGTRGDTLGLLKELEFTALLGDAACTDIVIDSFTWTDGNATATTANGEFCISELCKAGGNTRLISAGGGEFMLMQNKPNPAGDETEIEYTLTEPGYTTLVITDMLGRTVKTLVDENAAAGRYSVKVTTIDIPSGLYMYILKTPTQATTQTMQVSK